jgi:uncharacterized repeat protein (TIGR02059 family)
MLRREFASLGGVVFGGGLGLGLGFGCAGSSTPAPDVTAPTLSSAVIPSSGLTLVLTYNEPLDAASVPAAGAFSLSGTAQTVSSVGVSGSAVTLTLSGAVGMGATISLTYTPGGAPIRDLAGNNAASITAHLVTNNSTVTGSDVTAPTISSAVVQSAGTSIVLTYNEALDSLSVPAVGAYSLAGTVAAVKGVSIVGATVVLAVAPAIVPSATVTVSYTPGAAPIRDAAGNNSASLSSYATTNSSTADPPLGASNWSLWADARDYENVFSSGDTVSANLTPRVGSSTINPVNSPTVVNGAVGIGNRMAFKHVAASNMSFTAHWLASIMNGSKKTATIVFRGQRNAAAAAIWAGFGKAASGTNSFFELALAAAGQAIARKNDGTTGPSRTGSTVLGSSTHSVIVTTSSDGNTMYLFVDGASDGSALDISALGSVTIDQFRIGNSGRLTGGGGLDGIWQVCGVSSNIVDATQAATIHAALIAGDIVTTGAQVYPVGDSLTKAQGMRKAVYDYYIGAGKSIDMVGAASDGTFPDNQHSGFNGVEIASIQARAVSELGTGKAFPAVKLVLLLGAVNDLNNTGADVSAILTAYANALTAIHNAATSSTATARIAVTTIMPLQPGTQGEAEVVAFNAGLPAVWNAFDSAHPSNTLLRWDLYTAIGGVWNPSYYLDSTHPNDAGWAAACAHSTAGLIQAISAYLNSIG